MSGRVEALGGVLRDVNFVRVTATKQGDDSEHYHRPCIDVPQFEHVFFDQLDDTLSHDTAKYNAALIRYATLAQSIHPFSVFAMLYRCVDVSARSTVRPKPHDVRIAGDVSRDSLMLALGATLADKPGLLDGNLRRMPHFTEAARFFFRCVLAQGAGERWHADGVESVLRSRRFCAALCRCARAALVSGALNTVTLLCAVADVAVAYIFDPATCERGMSGEVGSSTYSCAGTYAVEHSNDGNSNVHAHDEAAQQASSHAEMKRLEYEILDTLSFLGTFTSWALHNAATTFGVISAHVGDARHGVKEPCLRDGKSRPILVSRNVDIKPLPIKPRSHT